jgi:hypothetical protein
MTVPSDDAAATPGDGEGTPEALASPTPAARPAERSEVDPDSSLGAVPGARVAVGEDVPADGSGAAAVLPTDYEVEREPLAPDAGGATNGRSSANEPRDYRQVRFVGVEMTLPSPHPVLVLREIDAPFRRLEIPIGAAEGIAIAYAARGVPTPRPLTHELFTDALVAFDIEVATVRITDVAGAAFRAEIALTSPLGSRVLSCRPSDAVALALRQILEVPITVAAEVLEVAGA